MSNSDENETDLVVHSACFNSDSNSQERFSLLLSSQSFSEGNQLCQELTNGLPASILSEDEYATVTTLLSQDVAQRMRALETPTPFPAGAPNRDSTRTMKLRSSATQSQLSDNMKSQTIRNSVFIGLIDENPNAIPNTSTERFSWFDNSEFLFGSISGLPPWVPGEPNNFETQIEDCVEIDLDSLAWNDASCELEAQMLCRSTCPEAPGNDLVNDQEDSFSAAVVIFPILVILTILLVGYFWIKRRNEDRDYELSNLEINISTKQNDLTPRPTVPSGLKLNKNAFRGWSLRFMSGSSGASNR